MSATSKNKKNKPANRDEGVEPNLFSAAYAPLGRDVDLMFGVFPACYGQGMACGQTGICGSGNVCR